MRFLNYFVIICAALAASAFSYAPALARAGVQAGFDCGKASTETEKAICADPDTAEADRGMSISYSALLERANPALKEALRADQAEFLRVRAEAFESELSSRDHKTQRLLEETEMRQEFLNWIAVTDSSSLEGNWRNAQGVVAVKKNPAGDLAVEIDVSDQFNGSWLCTFEGVLKQTKAGEAEFQSKAGPLILRLDGATLNIPTPFCDESTSGGYGSAEGTYFRVGE